MSTETLTEWLLAAIAEDEERARFVARQIEGNNWQPFEPWKLSWHDEYDLLCIEPSRALAECEAKRRIVAEHEPRSMWSWEECSVCIDNEASNAGQEYGQTWPCVTMAALALPYADRPGYLAEWAPR